MACTVKLLLHTVRHNQHCEWGSVSEKCHDYAAGTREHMQCEFRPFVQDNDATDALVQPCPATDSTDLLSQLCVHHAALLLVAVCKGCQADCIYLSRDATCKQPHHSLACAALTVTDNLGRPKSCPKRSPDNRPLLMNNTIIVLAVCVLFRFH